MSLTWSERGWLAGDPGVRAEILVELLTIPERPERTRARRMRTKCWWCYWVDHGRAVRGNVGPSPYSGGMTSVSSIGSGRVTDGVARASASVLPPGELVALLEHPSPFVRLAAWGNPVLPVAEMERAVAAFLVRPYDLGAGSALPFLLANPAVPGELLERLAAGDDAMWGQPLWQSESTLALLLRHPNCPAGVLVRAAGDRRELVRAIAAAHSRLPGDAVRDLLADDSDYVRMTLISNPGVPTGVLRPFVQVGAAPLMLDALAHRFTGADRQACVDLLFVPGATRDSRRSAARYSVDPAQVSAACADEDEDVREMAAVNPVATDADRVMVALLRPAGPQMWRPL